ncbi:hypothetical protein V2S84_17180, partial [Azotobacter chroococcum]|nr:hypothetical protein [Azotobacter chroococcum]
VDHVVSSLSQAGFFIFVWYCCRSFGKSLRWQSWSSSRLPFVRRAWDMACHTLQARTYYHGNRLP